MSTQPRNNDASELEEAAEEAEVLKLEKEVEQMAQKILEYRTTLPAQLSSTISSLLASQRPIIPTNEVPGAETRMLPVSGSEAGVSEGVLVREKMTLSVTEDTSGVGEKIQIIKQKISSNTAELPVVLNRMKEYMARIDKLESSNFGDAIVVASEDARPMLATYQMNCPVFTDIHCEDYARRTGTELEDALIAKAKKIVIVRSSCAF